MALEKKKKAKPKKPAIEMTLWNVILSFPDLHDPKPYKKKIYYQTDVLLDADHPQLSELRKAITKVKTDKWGADKSEWPRGKHPLVQNGDTRKDKKGYKGRFFLRPSTQTPVPVVDPKGKTFNAQMVRGGMFANVAIRIAVWEFEGDEGTSIYLQGVQIDTKKKPLNFGGGKSVSQMFKMDDGEEDDTPRKKKKNKKSSSEEE